LEEDAGPGEERRGGAHAGAAGYMTDRIRRSPSGNTAALWILAILAAVFFLRTASTLLIPIALAVLISYALEPAVAWLERNRLPRWAGAPLVLLVILGVCAGGAYALKDDARQVVEMVPKAMDRARGMVASQLGPGAKAIQEAAQGGGATGGRNAGSAEAAGTAATSEPITGSLVQRGAAAIVAFAGHVVVVVFLTLFLLLSGHRVRDRLVEIAGPDPGRRRTASTIINDINIQIQRYLLVLLATAAMVAAATWGVLAWMGVQQAAMWGILAGVFNSIPYFGPVIVSGGLFAVGLAQGGGLTEAAQMSGVAIVITSLEGWLVTPPLMGKAERMSALAVFLGLLVWTWIWGGWGTILAVPMLVVIKSVADHVERFKPVGRLMAP
jgi:predicted PurR-regulated permease PerM